MALYVLYDIEDEKIERVRTTINGLIEANQDYEFVDIFFESVNGAEYLVNDIDIDGYPCCISVDEPERKKKKIFDWDIFDEDNDVSQELEDALKNELKSKKAIGRKQYFDSINVQKVLSDSEVIELVDKIRQGNIDAKRDLIESNLRLVWSVVKKYRCDLEFDERLAAGNLGLVKCVERYSYEKGTKFSTFAVPYIKGEIRTAYAKKKSSELGISVRDFWSMRKVEMIENRLKGEMRDVTDEDILTLYNEDVEKQASLEQIKKYRVLSSRRVVSLDCDYVGDDGEMISRFDKIENEQSPVPEDKYMETYDESRMMIFMHTYLTPREYEVMMMSQGIFGEAKMNDKDIAKRIGVSKERVEQIRESSLIKVKDEILNNKN